MLAIKGLTLHALLLRSAMLMLPFEGPGNPCPANSSGTTLSGALDVRLPRVSQCNQPLQPWSTMVNRWN